MGLSIEEIEHIVKGIRRKYQLRHDGMNQDIGTYASGNWGHHGLKGQVGGSSKGGSKANRGTKMEDGTYTSSAKQRKEAEKKARAARMKARDEAKKEAQEKTDAPKIAGSSVTVEKTRQRLDAVKKALSEKDYFLKCQYLEKTGAVLSRKLMDLTDRCSEGDEEAKKQVDAILEQHFKTAVESTDVKSLECKERDKLVAMSREEREKWIDDVVEHDVPYGLNDDSEAQKVAYALGLNETPQVVCKEDLDAYVKETGAVELYRGLTSSGFVNAAQMVHMMAYEKDMPYFGAGIYGDGLYFANDKQEATTYGGNPDGIYHTLSRCALRKDAKVFRYHDIDGASVAMEAIEKCGYSDQSIGAMCEGYDVIEVPLENNMMYYCVLNKAALIMEDPMENLNSALARQASKAKGKDG